jgi:flagellar basal body-associated protein FliL
MGAGTDKTRDLAAGLMAGPPEVDLPPAPAVVTLPDLIVNRVAGDEAYLKARLAVVTVPGLEAEVQKETPALLDIANGFLPQLDDIDLRGGAGLARTRMELRYRFNLVLEAEDAVTDVLILEIVTN